MTDEKFVFIQDSKEKKNIAHSARNRRTHAGKGGKVRSPSDYLSKKELQAMNGEVTAYPLNRMMTWKEFKAMPDDIKCTYIKLIREKYNPYDKAIAEAMGINRITLGKELKRLGLDLGKSGGGNRDWDEEGFKAFCGDCNPDPVEELAEKAEAVVEDLICENDSDSLFSKTKELPVVENSVREEAPAIPYSGSLTFNGAADAALKTVMNLLGGSEVHIHISWEFVASTENKMAVV